MFLKEKNSSNIKGWGVLDGRKQRLWKFKEETLAQVVMIESIMLACAKDSIEVTSTVMIESIILTWADDSSENRNVAIVDIPGAFL